MTEYIRCGICNLRLDKRLLETHMLMVHGFDEDDEEYEFYDEEGKEIHS